MEASLGFYWGTCGIMEKKMETTNYYCNLKNFLNSNPV